MGIDKVNPGDPGGRPIPDKPRKPNDDMRIYAILVGINDYAKKPDEERDIPLLSGCVADVARIRTYLQNQYGEKNEAGELVLKQEMELSANDAREEGDRVESDVPFSYKQFGKLHICELLDEQATYSNILHAFEQVFIGGTGTGDDSYWFHFSGHGTQQFTAREFYRPKVNGASLPSMAPSGRDQCLVCYNPEGELDNILLADKELAYVINRTYSDKVNSNDEKTAHIVFTLDCCHSGTGTRGGSDSPFKTRSHKLFSSRNWEEALNEDGAQRPLVSYYKGEYHNMITEGETTDESRLVIPEAPHILLAGSDALEEAGDANFGGLFTASLMDILEGTEAINYLDAFNQTRNTVIQTEKKHRQTPQIDPLAGFNPYTRFLEGWALEGNAGYFPLQQLGSDWFVRCGAINGLPVDGEELIEMTILDARDRQMVGNAFVVGVGVQDSLLEMGFAVEKGGPRDGRQRRRVGEIATSAERPENIVNGAAAANDDQAAAATSIDVEEATEAAIPPPPALVLDSEKSYVAQVKRLPAEPFLFHDEANMSQEVESYIQTADLSEERAQEVRDLWTRLGHLNIHFSTQAEGTSAKIQLEGDSLQMIDSSEDLEEFSIEKSSDNYMDIFLKNIEKLVKWKRMLRLSNPNSQLHNNFTAVMELSDKFNLAFNPPFDVLPFDSMEIQKPAINFLDRQDTNHNRVKVLPYRIRLDFKNKIPTEDLYFYLFNMEEDGAISILATAEGLPELRVENTAQDEHLHLTPALGMFLLNEPARGLVEEESVMIHKLLVARRQIDPELLTQKSFAATRSGGLVIDPSANRDDWNFLTLRVRFRKA